MSRGEAKEAVGNERSSARAYTHTHGFHEQSNEVLVTSFTYRYNHNTSYAMHTYMIFTHSHARTWRAARRRFKHVIVHVYIL